MKYAVLDSISRKKLSRLVYGTGNAILMGEDEGAAFDCLDRAWEQGFTVFDSANAYGNAEMHLGKWMDRRGLREKTVLFDKGCNPGQKGSRDRMSADLIRSQSEESCRRLQTDHLDFYVLHRDDVSYPVEAVIEVLNELKEKGRIGCFGASNWTISRIREANTYAESHKMEGFRIVSPAYSLAEMAGDPWGGSVSLSGAVHEEERIWYAEQGIPVFAYSSLARGFLSGKYRTDGEVPIEKCLWWAPIQEYDCPVNRARLRKAERLAAEKCVTVSQICLAWLLNQSLDVFPIVGPASEKHMADNVGALDVELSEEEWRGLL